MSWGATGSTFSWGNPQPSAFSTNVPTNAPVAGPITPQQLIQWIEHQAFTQHPQCRFRYPFYNKIDEVNKVGKPAKMSDGMYKQAMENNPDPQHLTPVLAEGFKDLKVRLEVQHKAQQDHKAAIDSIKTYLEELRQTHTLDVTVALDDYRIKQMNVASRILQLELLRHRQQSIQRGEEQFRSQIENIHRELHQPDQYKSRLSEIVSRVSMQEDRGSIPYPQIEEEDQAQICKVLQEAGNGLNALVTDIKKDSEAITIILEKYKEAVASLGHL